MPSSANPVLGAPRGDGLSLRQAAVITGLGYLLMPVTYAEFGLMPKLVVHGNIQQTVANLNAHTGLFAAAILCYLITFCLDLVITWSLYILLAPVNRALSLLAAGFRITYTMLGLVGLLKLVTVLQLIRTPIGSSALDAAGLQTQAQLMMSGFRSDWNFSLILFGIHLVLVGSLIVRCSYIPKLLGVVLVINGLGWVITSLQPIAYPGAHLGFLAVTYVGELLFMLWLLIFGWRIKDPAPAGM
jgi:hypothetical protein